MMWNKEIIIIILDIIKKANIKEVLKEVVRDSKLDTSLETSQNHRAAILKKVDSLPGE